MQVTNSTASDIPIPTNKVDVVARAKFNNSAAGKA